MFDSLKSKFYSIKVKKARKNRPARSSVPYHFIKYVGIVYDATTLENYELVKKYAIQLESEGKTVQMLGYYPVKINSKETGPSFNHFSKNDITWYGVPKSPNVLDFIENPFELLVTLSLNRYEPLEYIAQASKSKISVGRSFSEVSNYDLSVDIGSDLSIPLLVDRLDYYIKTVLK